MVDVCTARFSSAIESDSLKLVCASVEKLPLRDGAVDKACTVNTIYFWSDAAASASELHRVIAAGGRLVIGFAPRETLDRLPVTEYGFAKYGVDEVRALLIGAGFDEVTVTMIEDPDGYEFCVTAIILFPRAHQRAISSESVDARYAKADGFCPRSSGACQPAAVRRVHRASRYPRWSTR
jgi:SAM-dependent methyltransferase